MFSASHFLRNERNSIANDMGFNDCWCGINKANPYCPGSSEFNAYETGWKEACEMLDEYQGAYYYPLAEYEE